MSDDDADVRIAIASASRLGEGPTWLPAQQRLWLCDIPARRMTSFDPGSGALDHLDFHTDVGSFAPLASGAFLVALRDGIWHVDPATDRREQLAAAPYDMAEERFNDGKCDASGRFWVGSMDEPRRPGRAALHCFENGRLARREGGITISNGLAWSPDGRTMYWADTPAHVVWAFDYDAASGKMSNRRDFICFDKHVAGDPRPNGGWPDGAAVDAEGCYWVAMYAGGRVLRFSPAGELLREVQVPALCPTMPCFGGADLKTVFVTSASTGRPADELARYPHSGCTFSFRVDVPGLPVDYAAAP